MSDSKLMYDYDWGDEEVLASKITVTRVGDDLYRVEFSQDGTEYFGDLKVGQGEEVSRKVVTSSDEHLRNVTIVLTIKAILNPRPEKLFIITDYVKLQELTGLTKKE